MLPIIEPPLSIGAVARRLGCRPWQVRRLYERNILPPPARVGLYRAIPVADLPAVEAALREAGYLPAQTTDKGGDECRP